MLLTFKFNEGMDQHNLVECEHCLLKMKPNTLVHIKQPVIGAKKQYIGCKWTEAIYLDRFGGETSNKFIVQIPDNPTEQIIFSPNNFELFGSTNQPVILFSIISLEPL